MLYRVVIGDAVNESFYYQLYGIVASICIAVADAVLACAIVIALPVAKVPTPLSDATVVAR